MKHKTHRRNGFRSGFTLVELLVVIGIIAILAAAVLAGATQAINSAKRAKCQSTANQIQTAVINYYTEYSTYPEVSGSSADGYYNNKDTADWTKLTEVLCGNINPETPTQAVASSSGLNSRNIPFFSPSKNDLGDTAHIFPRNPFTTQANPDAYFIVMDSDYSNVAGDTGGGAGQMPDFVASQGKTTMSFLSGGVTQGVAVWSNSQDVPYPGASTIHPQWWARTY